MPCLAKNGELMLSEACGARCMQVEDSDAARNISSILEERIILHSLCDQSLGWKGPTVGDSLHPKCISDFPIGSHQYRACRVLEYISLAFAEHAARGKHA